jgi:maleylacetate reductase
MSCVIAQCDEYTSAWSAGEHTALPAQRVVWGAGTTARAPSELAMLGRHRVLLLTTRSRAGSAAQRVADALGPSLVAVHDGMRAHVPNEAVHEAAERALELRSDALVTVGGGSAIDGGKAVAAAIARAGAAPVAHIALPTTLSGAELSHYYGVTEGAAKNSFVDASVVPQVVILDPELTTQTPDPLWCGSGLKALDHAIEGMLSPGERPLGDVLALAGVRALAAALPAARDPHDLGVRLACQIAAWQCYAAPANIRLGISHRIGHVLGGAYGVPHSLTSGITLPAVLRASTDRHARPLALVAAALDPEPGADPAERVADLVQTLGLPGRLRDVGIDAHQVPGIARRLEVEYPDEVAALAADGNAALRDLLSRAY